MTTALAAAAHQRTHDTRHRAVEALRHLDTDGQTITFNSVAHQAGVSRSWLYRQPDLRAKINRLRTPAHAPTAPVPSAQRASTDSLRQRLDTTLADPTTQDREPATPRTTRPALRPATRQRTRMNTSAACPRHADPAAEGSETDRSR